MEFLFQRAGLEEPNEKDSAPMDNVNGIISAFSNLRVNDTMVEKQAENDILEYMRHPESILSFMYIITNCDVPVVRLSPMLLMCVVPPNGRSLFEKGDHHLLEHGGLGRPGNGFAFAKLRYSVVKQQLLDVMAKESYELARRAICGVVSILATSELKEGRWQEVLQRMNSVL